MILLQLFWSFFKVGLFSFGGGYGMLPLIQQEIILVQHWLTQEQFMDIVAISQITPGPIAVNSATFVGYRVAGTAGSAIATLGVVLPSFLVVTCLTVLIAKYGQLELGERILSGLRPVAVALIAYAAISLGRTALVDLKSWLIGIGVFLAVKFTKLHPILIIALSALAGAVVFNF